MVTRALGLVAAFGVVAGCHSTPTVAPYPVPWSIDDFEDGDGESAAYGFAGSVLDHWECRPKDENHPIQACEVITDPFPSESHQESKVLHLKSELWPREHGDEFTRSEVGTFIYPPLDLTAYKEFSLSANIIGQDRPLKLKFQLSCVQARTQDGGVSPNPSILWPTEGLLPSGWTSYRTSLSKFDSPGAIGLQQRVAPKDCLARVDGIKITIDSESGVPEGQTWTFDLYIDDVKFLPRD